MIQHKTLDTMLYTFLKKYTLLLCLLLASLSGQAKETDPEIQRRIATGTKELKTIIAQNAWNNAHGLSHLNRYVFGNTKWIKVHQQAIDNPAAEAINALLVKYNEQAAGGKPYVYNAVKLYVYLGGIQGFKAPKPAKNETIAQTIARMKREGDRRLYEYTQYQTALRKEYQVLKGIMKSAPAAFQKSSYQMLAGLAMYLDVYPEKIALKPNEVLVAGIHGILPNASLSKTDGAIAPVLRSQMRSYMKAVIKEQPQLTPTEARQRRAQATQKLVEALLAQLGNYHPVKNPAKIDLNAEMPKLLTITHQAAKVEAMQSQVPTQAQSELAGKVEVWNYTGLKAKGFRWAATEDDKMRAEFVKKIVLVVTNSHTSRSTLFDIANRKGRFNPGDDEMVFWVHYTDARHHTATFWYSPQVEEALQKLKADQGVRRLFEDMMRRGVDEMGKSLTQVCGAVHYVTRMLTNCIKAGQIPEKYWNREHKDYVKSMRWVLAIVAMDFSGGELATRYFALSCGLWNGTLKTVGDITGLVAMFTGYVSDPKLRSQMDGMFKTLKDKGFFNLIGEQFGKHFNALAKINHKSFYLLGEDIIFILSMATGAGELGLFAKGGKLAKLGQGLNGAVKGGKAALTVAQNSFRVLRRQLAGQVNFVYRKTTQAYDIVASGKVIATLQGGKIKVKRWINTTQDKILHPKSMDNSPDGKFIAKNEKGEYGVCNRQGKACFVAGTLILTNKGYKKIEDIKAGDWVWSYNEQTNKQELKQVTSTIELKASALILLKFSNEQIYATSDHPFYLEGKWVKAGNLSQGDRLHLFQSRKIALNHLIKIDTSVTVYNFAVADNHNYFVGQNRVLVHNSNGCGDLLARTNSQALKDKINALGDGKSKFLDDFKNASDDVLAKFEAKPELVEAWKKLLDDAGETALRKNVGELQKITDNLAEVKKIGYSKWKVKSLLNSNAYKELDDLLTTSKISEVEFTAFAKELRANSSFKNQINQPNPRIGVVGEIKQWFNKHRVANNPELIPCKEFARAKAKMGRPYEHQLKNGLLDIFNPKKQVSYKDQTVMVDFVITREGKLIVGRKHGKMADEFPVRGAGEFVVVNGKVRSLTNKSGHYQPNVAETKRMIKELEEMGLDLSEAKIFDLNKNIDLVIQNKGIYEKMLKNDVWRDIPHEVLDHPNLKAVYEKVQSLGADAEKAFMEGLSPQSFRKKVFDNPSLLNNWWSAAKWARNRLVVSLKRELRELLGDQIQANQILSLYRNTPDLLPRLSETVKLLKTHKLSAENNLKILKNKAFVEASVMREQGIKIKPEWWNDVNNRWLKTFDKKQANLSKSELLEYRKNKMTTAAQDMQAKKGRVVEEIGVVFGRRPAYEITKEFDDVMKTTNQLFIHDPSWRKWGIILPKVLPGNFLDNVVQACETAARIKTWNLVVNGKKLKGKVYINLEDYNIFNAMHAMYGNPNSSKVINTALKNKGNPFHQTRITDMEIANIVRNKKWFENTGFIKKENGVTRILSKQEVEQTYGIKYIGDIAANKFK
ncbi:polymorphic toxin-type HINT domain-containing protein [Microscilla marina]|nr:polymorphic toxin-type HINT domain-containing protein [Microscilla marina]